MQRSSSFFVVITVLALASGCPRTRGAEGSSSSSGSTTQQDGGGGNIDAGMDAGNTTVADAGRDAGRPDSGCLGTQVRDGRGVCRTTCGDAGQCPTNETCSDMVGLCLPRPATCVAANCPRGYTCPTTDGGVRDAGPNGCVPIEGYCDSDRDCSLVDRCDNNLCVSRAGDIVRTCGNDAGCPLLMNCTFGVCTGCLADLQCSLDTAGARCLAGTCVSTGALGPGGDCIGKTCPDGQRCNVGNGQCEPTCMQDSDCADGGKICAPVLNQCVTDFGCNADGGCAAGLMCAGQGAGLERGICTGCNDTTPCGPGLVCIVGACFPDLAATACTGVTCATNESCDPQNGDCYPSSGTCTDATQCREGHTCNFLGLCAGCSVDADCRPAQRCFIGTCLPAGG